jgi:hypothetical protein
LTVKIGKRAYTAALRHEHHDRANHTHGEKPEASSKTSKRRLPGTVGSLGRSSQHPTMPWARDS